MPAPTLRRGPWAPHEDAQLRAMFGTVQRADIGRTLGRSAAAVTERACRLGLMQFAAQEDKTHEAAIRSATQQLGQRLIEVAAAHCVALPQVWGAR